MEVLVDLVTDAADRPFHYCLPPELRGKVTPGSLVKVPFGRRQYFGYITRLLKQPEVEKVRPIDELISPGLLSPEQLELIPWLANRYYCRMIEALRAIIPAGNRRGKRTFKKQPANLDSYRPETDENCKPLELTADQRQAVKIICSGLDRFTPQKFLLHGVTGSGKTEVYLRAIEHCLHQGREVIVLIPEISLTPQMIERFKQRFSKQLAVLHSRLTPASRSREWERIKSGQAPVVLGARSAVFAPLSNIGLLIIDEEHENSYKQEEAPRYHAREVAWWRAGYHRSVLVLGSATPSLESYYEVEQGRSKRLNMPARIESDLPPVQIVDMRSEIKQGHRHIFSRRLQEELSQVITRGEQAILFLNRRGFATFILCRECGYVARCPRCHISLTMHLSRRKIVCHYCSYESNVPQTCPNCGGIYIRFQGVGTERVEKEVKQLFPGPTVIRMDSDTTSKRGSHELLYRQFRDKKASILVGTQMIAKGLDFPEVTLVGVITADTALNLPDFRAAERT
ncbi:MAG TPA: primosomal protein N', partial [Firmicutes bacterium]|nr:primosomal protein N' [Bacillota bacterium]